jgi:3-keto-5-aminohexanoate cleavage enzyme
MEDSVWKWPHRDDKIKNNLEIFLATKQIIELLGREIIDPNEFRQMMGMRKPGGKLKK